MSYATIEDIEDRYEPITGHDLIEVPILLNKIERRLRRKIRRFDDLVAMDPEYKENVIDVECDAAIRVLKNPQGLKSEAEGSYSYSLDPRVASGFLLFTDEEWDLLNPGYRAFTINPTPRRVVPDFREGVDWTDPDIRRNGL